MAPDVVLKADVIAVDDVSQAREEAGGDLIMAGDAAWSRVVPPLADIVVGRVRGGRQGDDSVTIFKSLGIAVEDLVLAKLIYDRAVRERRGVEFEFRGVFR